jgi:hypothetical protein
MQDTAMETRKQSHRVLIHIRKRKRSVCIWIPCVRKLCVFCFLYIRLCTYKHSPRGVPLFRGVVRYYNVNTHTYFDNSN